MFQLGGPGLAHAGIKLLPDFWLCFAFVDTVWTIFTVSIIHLHPQGLSGCSRDFLLLVFHTCSV